MAPVFQSVSRVDGAAGRNARWLPADVSARERLKASFGANEPIYRATPDPLAAVRSRSEPPDDPSMTAPAWARELVTVVCAQRDVQEPRLAWRTRAGEHSTGVTRRHDGTVAVRAGTDDVDQRLTLLHELAHWLAPAARRTRRTIHHGAAFYATAFALYREHGIPDADALRLESARYRSSLRHAVALGIPGAVAALAEHRAALGARPRRRWRVLVGEHRIRLQRDGRWTICATCGQKVVGVTLARIRRARRPVSHVLMTSAS